jgi:hypothetical protein
MNANIRTGQLQDAFKLPWVNAIARIHEFGLRFIHHFVILFNNKFDWNSTMLAQGCKNTPHTCRMAHFSKTEIFGIACRLVEVIHSEALKSVKSVKRLHQVGTSAFDFQKQEIAFPNKYHA